MSNPKKSGEERETLEEPVRVSEPQAAPVIVAPAPAPIPTGPQPRTVTLRNKMRQKIHLNIPDKTGKFVGIEIAVGEKRRWTYLGATLGPDFASKARKKYVCLG